VKVDQFYDRVNGAYFGLISIGISLLSVFLAVISYESIGNVFSFQDTFLSTFGDTPGVTTLIYSGGVVLVNFFKLFFSYYLFILYFRRRGVSRKVTWVLFGFSLIATFSYLLHLIPYSISATAHIGGTILYFLASVFSFFVISIVELKTDKLPNYLAIFGFIVIICYFTFLRFLLELEAGIFINRTTAVTVEWFAYLSVLVWVIVHSVYVLKNPYEETENLPDQFISRG
ncbi:MAG: hypothetical protein ACXABJ_08455, partial [Candidatus Heimdallarchaeaceae archaeon]